MTCPSWAAGSKTTRGGAPPGAEEVPGKISDRSVTRTVEGMVGGALSTVLVLAVTVAVLLDGEYLVAAIRRLCRTVG